MNILDFVPNSVYKFYRWTWPEYFWKQADGIEIDNVFSSPFSRRVNAAWHQKMDSVHSHTLKYRLMKSICDNDLSEIKTSLDANPSLINATFKDGFTPLSLASSLNKTSIIDYLLLRGADLELIDDQGRTPLIQALINWQIETIKILTERGANITTKGAYGFDALELAKIRNYEQITKFLELQKSKSIKTQIPPHTFTLNIETQMQLTKRMLTKPEIPQFEQRVFPFNDYKGLYQINFI